MWLAVFCRRRRCCCIVAVFRVAGLLCRVRRTRCAHLVSSGPNPLGPRAWLGGRAFSVALGRWYSILRSVGEVVCRHPLAVVAA